MLGAARKVLTNNTSNGTAIALGEGMQKNSKKPKVKCKNCEGNGLIKKGNVKLKCQRCGGTGFKP